MRLVLAALLTLLVAAAPASAKTLEAFSGDTRAVATWTQGEIGPKDVRLRVFEGDEQIVDRAIPDREYLLPVDVAVRDLEGDGDPEAIFTLYSGGAHCCITAYVYEGVRLTEGFYGNVGYVLKRIAGRLAFVTADDRFAYRYAPYAGSLFPLLVQRYEDGELVDITRDKAVRPRLRREARTYKRFYQRAHRNDPGITGAFASPLAAYTADMCNLGNCQKGYALAAKAVERGEVGARFVKRLERDMRRLGYSTGESR